MPQNDAALKLPDVLVGSSELAEAENQMDTVQDFFKKTSERAPGEAVQMPKGTKLVEDVAKGLKLNLLAEPDRQKIAQLLRDARKFPLIDVSLAGEPTAAMTTKLVSWLRASIDPKLLVNISVQPGLGAGCVIRTKNNKYDFSLRAKFSSNRELLTDYLSATEIRQN